MLNKSNLMDILFPFGRQERAVFCVPWHFFAFINLTHL